MMRRDAGVSLIEMVVAVLILSIAVVALFRVYDESVRSSAGHRDRALALILAQNRAEEIALGQRNLPEKVRLAGRDWLVTTKTVATLGGFAEINIRVTPSEGGAGMVLVTYAADGTS
jgi:general secretion pathway protein I